MNRQQLTYFRVVALIMSGLVASLTIGNLFTIATKGISVTLPTEEEIQWSIDPIKKEILFRTTFSVKNQGVYDIRNIDLSAHLVKEDKTPLFSFEKQDMMVLHGTNTTFDLLIPFDLNQISLLDWFSLIYSNTTLQLLLNVDAFYMFGLIEFTASEVIDVPWEPPLLNLSDNTTLQKGIQGLFTLLTIASNNEIPSLSNVIALCSLPPSCSFTKNGFSFSFTSVAYAETMKTINCHIIVPLLVIEGRLAFTASFLVGLEENHPVFQVQEVDIEYVF